MKIIIAGVGEVGRHCAAVLAADGHEITLIDTRAEAIESAAENLDIRILVGSAAHADTLIEAGAEKADLFVAATDADEINLLAASLAKGLGTPRVIARVHHSVYHDHRGLDYARHFGIDRLVCPEYLTSLAIAGMLRDPAVQAIQHFVRGQITMEQLEISERSEMIGRPLKEISLPLGFRIGTVSHEGRVVVPTGETVLGVGDQITLIGATGVFDKVVLRFSRAQRHRQNVVIMGGSAVSVWLARALAPRLFKVRIFLLDRSRAEELANKLPYATVLEADPTDPDTFAEENIADVDAFVAAGADDENNILGALQVRHLGVRRTMAVLQRSTYHELIEGLGIDRVFSPRLVASQEIQHIAQRQAIHELLQLDENGTSIFEIEVGQKAAAIGKTLRELSLPAGCMFIAIQRADEVHVPGPMDRLEPGDAAVAIAHKDSAKKLKALFT